MEKSILTDTDILEQLKGLIKPYLGVEIDLSKLTGDELLIDDLKINSAHIVDIIIDIESSFDIMIDDESINEMNTVGDSVSVIKKMIQK